MYKNKTLLYPDRGNIFLKLAPVIIFCFGTNPDSDLIGIRFYLTHYTYTVTKKVLMLIRHLVTLSATF